MRLLRFEVEGASLYKDKTLKFDLFATDRVVKQDGISTIENVHKVGTAGSIYSQNVIGLSGVNASGKTTTLNLLSFVLNQLSGNMLYRSFDNERGRLGKLEDEIKLVAVFFHDGNYFLSESIIRKNTFDSENPTYQQQSFTDEYIYSDEVVWILKTPRITRAMISQTSEFKANAEILINRNESPDKGGLPEEARKYLPLGISITSAITSNDLPRIDDLPERILPETTLPTPVVQAFDGSIEKLVWDPNAQVYHLKFKGEDELVYGREAVMRLLSNGTVSGSDIICRSIDILKKGGYLILDEIEDGLNRSLVIAIMDIFASPVTNPHGAQLIFSTHYPELLDSINRKDAIYVLIRDEKYQTELVKYSDRINRIENKKSEVIISNLIKGSMPRYPDVQAMREYVRQHVNA